MTRSAAIAGAAITFAVIVVFILANPPDAHALLFDGGKRDGLFGLAMFALVPLLVVVQIGLGTAFANRFVDAAVPRELWLLWLSGSALLSLIGVVVAVAGLVNPWVCGSVLVLGIAYAAGTGICADIFGRFFKWMRLEGVTSYKLAFALVRIGIVAALLLIGLRAATGELNDTDVVQFYWGWLNEVRHLGGIGLSTELPMLDFAAGRGNGTYLLLAGVAPGLVSHVVSASCCIMFAFILRAFLQKTESAIAPFRSLTCLAADMACLVALWMLPGSVAFGKYHLQFASWALGFLLVSLQVANDDVVSKANRRLALPLAIAIAIGLAQFEAFVVLVLPLAVMAARRKWKAALSLSPLLFAGVAGAAISLAANWIYLGIPDYNPFPLFEHFIIEPRFDLWTSRLQQYYLNYIQGGALTFKAGNGVGTWRELRSLLGGIFSNLGPIILVIAGLIGVALVASLSAARRVPQPLLVLLGTMLGYVLYRISLHIAFYDLATDPAANRLALYSLASIAYLAAVRPFRNAAARPYLLGLLGYWLICGAFILVFHSGSMGRLMRHADVVFVGLLLVAIVQGMQRLPVHTFVVPMGGRDRSFRLQASAAMPLLLALGVALSFHSAASAWAVDPPEHMFASTLGLQGRAIGLTNPMARFDRCDEISSSVPASARVLVLNAYTAMAYCNNSVLLPRTMMVLPHASDFARGIATSAFANADTVEQTLRSMQIDYFPVLKGDSEFWASGLSAPFRPDELNARFDLLTETPSFYILTWRGMGHPIPQQAHAAITEWRRIAIQQHGFMAQNKFVGQWRAMANLGAERPGYTLGSRLDFTSKGWSALYADHGWYQADTEGTWTVGPEAIIRLPLVQATPDALRMTVEVMPFVIPQLPVRMVHVRIGATEVATWNFKLGDGVQTKEILLPPGAGADGKIELDFDIENTVSPYALGLSSDWRPLGISIRSLVLETADHIPK